MLDVNKLHTAFLKASKHGWQTLKFQVSLHAQSFKTDLSPYAASAADLQYANVDTISKYLYPDDGQKYDSNCNSLVMAAASTW